MRRSKEKARGKGLGKDEVGMKEAIKVKLKFDTAGVGHNVADEHTYHWWDHLFNKAANNIQVEDSGAEVKVKCEEELQLSTKKPLSKGLSAKDLLYGRFIKSGTLSDGIVEKEAKSESESDSEDEDNLVLSTSQHTDEQLFNLCGGLTAHKGARHGLNASAKLSRVMEQEAAFMAKWAPKEGIKHEGKLKRKALDEDAVHVDDASIMVSAKKKKHKKSKTKDVLDREPSGENLPEAGDTNEIITDEQSSRERKRKKKEKKSKKQTTLEPTVENENVAENQNPERELSKKEKKKRKNKDTERSVEAEEETRCDTSSDTEIMPVKKKKKKSKDKDLDELVHKEADTDSQNHSESIGKKSKKKKKKSI